jgi:hypothetical protein
MRPDDLCYGDKIESTPTSKIERREKKKCVKFQQTQAKNRRQMNKSIATIIEIDTYLLPTFLGFI